MAAGSSATGYLLCADPVHLQVDRDQLLLDPAAVSDLGAQEAAHLTAALNQHFGADSLHFEAITPLEWVLEVPRVLELAAPAPQRLAGRPAAMFLPRGADAAWARRLANETQMLLHQAQVNQERESARKAAVNSVWLWGGGQARADVAPVPQKLGVFSPAKHVRELARSAGAASAFLPQSWPQWQAERRWIGLSKVLIDLTEISSTPDWPAILQADWLIPAQRAVRAENMDFWCVLLGESKSARTRLFQRDLFHLLRRNSLAQYVDNGQNRSKA
jgi:hypothetical protein